MKITRNLTLMTDLYELTMMNGYHELGTENKTAVFDVFFRQAGQISYAVSAGLEQAVDYIRNLHFDDEDIEYLRRNTPFSDSFLLTLKNFRFTGDVWAVPEGTIVFPNEPIMIIRAPLAQAQLIEPAILNIINHQTLIATKASRVKKSAGNASVAEFGLRRAQGPDAGIYGARASVIGGCSSTSNVLAGQAFDIPIKGTMAHSWIMSFESELEAFRKFAEIYPDNTLLLVDTYDTLRSGIPNAIKVFDELKARGKKPVGIRLDSGDLAYLSKKARKMLDEAGHKDAIIFASCDLDEFVISSLAEQGAKIDAYGVGTRLITSQNMPSLGGVYKLAELTENGKQVAKIKISDTHEKITNPGFKTLYRVYDEEGMAFADLIALEKEKIDESKPLTLTHPTMRWKTTTLEKYTLRKLLVPVFEKGRLVYELPALGEICDYNEVEKKSFWDEYLRNVNPEIYKVDLSDELYELKTRLIAPHFGGKK
ncbi:MAG: nicotinate phosphoribosyltransferase [Clostridia bacterium]|nr:nicotinate phosphoribosyltransferase [Clostridia bacterium]